MAELATQHFITNDVPNVKGLILAGLSLFKNDLSKSDLFDPRLSKVVIAIVDVAYGGENGFTQAIELAGDALANVRFCAEQKLLTKLFEEIDKDTGRYCYGIKDTFEALEQGAVETLIMWEDLEMIRMELQHPETDKIEFKHVSPAQREADAAKLLTAPDGATFKVLSEESLTEWFAEHYRDFGCKLEFVSDKSEEGSQFCRGFGGVGGLLRYKVDFFGDAGDMASSDEDSSEFI